MDQVIPGLWIGGLPSAMDTENLKKNKIYSVLSAMRGKISIHETFVKHQIFLDDSEEEDILIHLLPAIAFIQSELDKGRGVLVHCQAGVSRSATIVAAYLMHNRRMGVEGALDLIRKARPEIDPNPGFIAQLEIFHNASFNISRKDKDTRLYYMQRTTEEVMNGDGSLPSTDMFARFPRSAIDSTPSTPGGTLRGPRRRIRCKMCRQELAAREHMLDHGQIGPATPVITPATSRRPSTTQPQQPISRRSSRLGSDSRPRRPSGLAVTSPPLTATPKGPTGSRPPIPRPFGSASKSIMETMSMSALDSDDEDDEGNNVMSPGTIKLTNIRRPSGSATPTSPNTFAQVATHIGRRMSNAMLTPPVDETHISATDTVGHTSSPLVSPNDFAAQLHANPKLAALRGGVSPPSYGTTPLGPVSPPILMNPKCSGYFVEPMQWMESFLEAGEIAGKIVCPNKRCGTKLGNYDWAGVRCGCKEWVVPGFCISRSKVDEIVA
ncbi:hypothetical protein EV368DRAFT_41057 [Lentinula lateritia]|uniref:Uncharacterized protein n=1 Tax=Lentinula aff. lateritia TaxID=2804960 RepID=A0ACC1U872_9AGAR|nr:hypothetical protein F5876DRAFT_36584 [Lentinula aff. lateritia]KAJ3852418.1 hypothetical protein EV368DRAFT_41057 [Lentinula lateritia]